MSVMLVLLLARDSWMGVFPETSGMKGKSDIETSFSSIPSGSTFKKLMK
jgi:hypothetical protein